MSDEVFDLCRSSGPSRRVRLLLYSLKQISKDWQMHPNARSPYPTLAQKGVLTASLTVSPNEKKKK